jgi:hypothetical protein
MVCEALENGNKGNRRSFADPPDGHCNRTVPKPYLLTLKGIRFERKQNPRNGVKEWKEKKLWVE